MSFILWKYKSGKKNIISTTIITQLDPLENLSRWRQSTNTRALILFPCPEIFTVFWLNKSILNTTCLQHTPSYWPCNICYSSHSVYWISLTRSETCPSIQKYKNINITAQHSFTFKQKRKNSRKKKIHVCFSHCPFFLQVFLFVRVKTVLFVSIRNFSPLVSERAC